MATADGGKGPVQARLGLWDAVSIIVGIVIGSSIYETPPTIFQNVSGPWAALGVWFLCGVLSLVGALCYAELATTYPHSGGDYVYLTRAFGPRTGFLFGWSQLAVVLPGSIAAMAFIFGNYAANLFDIGEASRVECATLAGAAAVIALAILNGAGVVFGKGVQNLLVATKVLGLGGIIVMGLMHQTSGAWQVSAPDEHAPAPVLGTAVILVLYAYGGWNDAALVAADVRRRGDITRSLVIGTLGITLVYLAVNAAYILGLGFDNARQYRPTIASDLMRLGLGEPGARAMNVLVMISALGAINGLLFTRHPPLLGPGSRSSHLRPARALAPDLEDADLGAGRSVGHRIGDDLPGGDRGGARGDRSHTGRGPHRNDPLGRVPRPVQYGLRRHRAGFLGLFPDDGRLAVRAPPGGP